MSRSATVPDLAPLTRPSGGLAMLALDQREALRAMFAEHQSTPVTDDQLTQFKVEAARRLSPLASGVLLDGPTNLEAAVADAAVAPGCGLVAAVDRFTGDDQEFVAEVEIDDRLDAERLKASGVVALKLLVLWRPDQPAAPRVTMVEEFLRRCRAAGLPGIIEPVSRAPRDGSTWTPKVWNDGVFAAARELGRLGADLYKAEVPLHGEGENTQVRAACAELTEIVDGPWVVLSTGVEHERFPAAVRAACQAGASGFLAGRAIWRHVVGATDRSAAFDASAAPRLRELVEIVDSTVAA